MSREAFRTCAYLFEGAEGLWYALQTLVALPPFTSYIPLYAGMSTVTSDRMTKLAILDIGIGTF